MKYLQTRKRIKPSVFRGVILLFIALVFFAGCNVYLLDASGTIADTGTIDDSDTGADSDTSSGSGTSSDSSSSSDSGTSSGSGTSSDSTSSVSYDLVGSYTGSSTLQSTFLAIMNNYTDTDWSKWLEEIGANTNGDLETQSVGTPVLTLSADGSFSMTVPYVSNYQANGELPVSGTWSVSGTTVTFTYGASIESWVNQTAPANLPGVIETLVNGAELWTNGSSLYGRFGYGSCWTDTSDELFTK